jgi:hypothetical protein
VPRRRCRCSDDDATHETVHGGRVRQAGGVPVDRAADRRPSPRSIAPAVGSDIARASPAAARFVALTYSALGRRIAPRQGRRVQYDISILGNDLRAGVRVAVAGMLSVQENLVAPRTVRRASPGR